MKDITPWSVVNTNTLRFSALIWVVFLFANIGARQFVTPNVFANRDSIRSYAWVIFVCVATTVIWIVLSRAISRFIRVFIFLIWLASITFVFFWNALIADTVKDVSLFCVISMMSFFLIAELSSHMSRINDIGRMSTLTLSVLFVVSAISLGVLQYLNKGIDSTMYYVVIGAMFYVMMHVLSIWSYLHRDKDIWLVENMYLFAFFSPLTESVDAFGVFTT